MADVRYWFDPVCPFCWVTSRWVTSVADQRAMDIEWRFISLRVINPDERYTDHFPPHYDRNHTGGLRLLRVCAAVREDRGPDAVGRLYTAIGSAIWEGDRDGLQDRKDAVAYGDGLHPALESIGLDPSFADARDDQQFDAVIRTESEEARGLTGQDLGTPIIQFDPPDGLSFFGPVISRIPDPEASLELWDHVVGLARFPGFAELKRSLRERVQFHTGATAAEYEEWHAGRVRP